MVTIIPISMAPPRMTIEAHQVLHQLFSPAFPVGAFAWSHGLESAIAENQVTDAASLQAWIADALTHGAGWADAVALSQVAHGADPAPLSDLLAALTPSATRRRETCEQGAAFAATVHAVWGQRIAAAPYPVAVGQAVRALGLPVGDALRLYLQAFVANLASAGVRLVPLGQTDGQRITAALLPLCAEQAAAAELATPDAIGGFAPLIDIAAQRQEALTTRLFRS